MEESPSSGGVDEHCFCVAQPYVYIMCLYVHNLAEYDHTDPLLLVWEGDWQQVGGLSWTSAGIDDCNIFSSFSVHNVQQ